MNNNLKFILFFLTLGLFMTSCEKEETTFGDLSSDDIKRGVIMTTSGSTPGLFNLSDLANASNSFSYDFASGSNGETPTSGVLTLAFNGSSPVALEQLSSLQGSYSISLAEAASIMNVSVDDLEPGDIFTFGFKDIVTPTGTYSSGETVNVPVNCLSELAGTYDYEATAVWCGEAPTSGTVEFIETAAGRYTMDDWSLGGYTSCYGGLAASWGTLALVDVCSKISIEGLDNYDDTWTFTIDGVDGSALTVSWSNTYGESGSAIITRTDGTDWPALFN